MSYNQPYMHLCTTYNKTSYVVLEYMNFLIKRKNLKKIKEKRKGMARQPSGQLKKKLKLNFFNFLDLYIIYYINIYFITSNMYRHFIDVDVTHY
jgi:hypothetical protein